MPQTHPYGTPAFCLPHQIRRVADLVITFRAASALMAQVAEDGMMLSEIVDECESMLASLTALREKAVEEVARQAAGL